MESESATQCGTVTVRLIRSFEYRNIKHIVYQNVNINQLTKEFKEFIDKDIKTRSGIPPPFKKFVYNTLKISHQPHGAKSSDPVINKENDEELILQEDKSLMECGIVNETEISYFDLSDYRKYQEHPESKW